MLVAKAYTSGALSGTAREDEVRQLSERLLAAEAAQEEARSQQRRAEAAAAEAVAEILERVHAHSVAKDAQDAQDVQGAQDAQDAQGAQGEQDAEEERVRASAEEADDTVYVDAYPNVSQVQLSSDNTSLVEQIENDIGEEALNARSVSMVCRRILEPTRSAELDHAPILCMAGISARVAPASAAVAAVAEAPLARLRPPRNKRQRSVPSYNCGWGSALATLHPMTTVPPRPRVHTRSRPASTAPVLRPRVSVTIVPPRPRVEGLRGQADSAFGTSLTVREVRLRTSNRIRLFDGRVLR